LVSAVDRRRSPVAVRPPATCIRSDVCLEDMMSASRDSRSLILSALLLVAAPAVARAQAVTVAARPSHAAQLKAALRAAAAAQARHRASKGVYASSLTMLRLPASPGVQVEILRAGPSAWQGRAVHQEQPGRSCVIFVGRPEGLEAPRTDGDKEMAGEEGVPLCDRMR
jgi:hypothetical protein